MDDLHTSEQQVVRALKVLLLTDHIRRYLASHDPKALEQADRAVAQATGICGHCGGVGVFCNKADGHDGDHGDWHDNWSRERCSSQSGTYRCDRPSGHAGDHGCYLGDPTEQRCSWVERQPQACGDIMRGTPGAAYDVGTRLRCTEPAGHAGDHRCRGLRWGQR